MSECRLFFLRTACSLSEIGARAELRRRLI